MALLLPALSGTKQQVSAVVLTSLFFLFLIGVPLSVAWGDGRESRQFDQAHRVFHFWWPSNLLAILTLVIEAVQLIAIPFAPLWPWPSATTSAFSWSLLEFADGESLIWFSVAAAISLRLFLESIRYVNFGSGGRPWAAFPYLYLFPFFMASAGVPMIRALSTSLACTFPESGDPVLDFSSKTSPIVCWTSDHLAYAVPALLTLALFLPMFIAVLPLLTQANPNLEIVYDGRYILLVSAVKSSLSIMSAFFREPTNAFALVAWYCMCMLTLFVCTIRFRPCNIPIIDTCRGGVYAAALCTGSIAAWVLELDDENEYLPFFVLVGLWGAILAICVVVCMRLKFRQNGIGPIDDEYELDEGMDSFAASQDTFSMSTSTSTSTSSSYSSTTSSSTTGASQSVTDTTVTSSTGTSSSTLDTVTTARSSASLGSVDSTRTRG
eukprot:TRINITY_DN934_c0_g3_i6.p1 TRINITY_DN934_c0_g3~~TRINITY_DN934_c0_g3_i6.p1  ORF type:complete len:437 (-),score=-12.54 TRINITY_DN934_c0_g3_i6:251-1561(-)